MWFAAWGLVGIALGFGISYLCVRRGWVSMGAAIQDGQDQLAFFVEGLRCVSGKQTAPCAKCGHVGGSLQVSMSSVLAGDSLRRMKGGEK